MKTYKTFMTEKYGAGIFAIGVGAYIVAKLYKGLPTFKKRWDNARKSNAFYNTLNSTNSEFKYINSLNKVVSEVQDEKDISKYITTKFKKKYHYDPNTESEWNDNVREVGRMANEVYPLTSAPYKEAEKKFDNDELTPERLKFVLTGIDSVIKKTGYFKPSR